MNRQELEDFLHNSMEEQIKPLVLSASKSVTDLIGEAFEKGFNLGLAVGLGYKEGTML